MRKPIMACVVGNGINQTKIMKITEYICRKENTEITFYINKTRKKSEIGDNEENPYTQNKTKRNKNEETIIIKPTEGNSYADIMRSMKEEITTEGILIDRVNRTNEGNIQVKIKGKEEKHRKEFKELLATKLIKHMYKQNKELKR